MSEDKIQGWVQKLKQKAQSQKNYGHELENNNKPAEVAISSCPNCGAGRAENDGLTKCAFCGFEFMQVTLTDGINIKKEDN